MSVPVSKKEVIACSLSWGLLIGERDGWTIQNTAIDDDETIRETLTLLLQDEVYIVDKAETGQEAIEKSNKNFYNPSIVDWRLPDIEGTKLLAA